MTRPLAVFIGPPAAGKTRIGKRVARILGADFVDTDKRFVALHGVIADHFSTHGERSFRELERAIVADALGEPAVVSLGGGAVLDPATQADLADLCVVGLTVEREAVAARIGGSKRPLLAGGGLDAWAELVERRRPIYDSLATRTWDTSSGALDGLAAEIAEWVSSRDGSATSIVHSREGTR